MYLFLITMSHFPPRQKSCLFLQLKKFPFIYKVPILDIRTLELERHSAYKIV